MILLPCRFNTGDYRAIIIDFRLDNVVRYGVNIYTLSIIRLIGYKPSVVARYNDKVKELIVSCKVNRRLDTLEDK